MDLDKIIHEKKTFGELEDADVEAFLRDRKFRSENLNLEFKSSFPQKSGGKFDVKKICKYIAGYSNEEGGLVVYGISDEISRPDTNYPNYIVGLTTYPRPEDLSQWVLDRIHPVIASPEIRRFVVDGEGVIILKIPRGVNKPYLYYEPDTRSVSYFKRASGNIEQLMPDQIREFYRMQIIEQSELLLRAAESQGLLGSRSQSSRAEKLKERIGAVSQELEDVRDFGFVGICTCPLSAVKIPVADLERFLTENRFKFSEALRYFPRVDVFQNGVSVGYFPRSIRQDIKSTMRVTLYEDGVITFGAMADTFMRGEKNLNPYWLAYELQRHLQLAKSLLKGFGVSRVIVELTLDNLAGFFLRFGDFPWVQQGEFQGRFEPILREVDFSDVYDHDGPKRNVAAAVVRDIVGEVCRVFGLSEVPRNLFDKDGILTYVKGIENQR